MSITKSLMLGSAAVLATVVGAQAADLPSKKAAPATYVKICDAYGAGFFFIPGTDTCVKLGGYVRAQYDYTPGKATYAAKDGALQQASGAQAETGYEVRGRIDVDARTPTSMGVARTFVRLRGGNTSGIRNTTITNNTAYTQADASVTALSIESAMVQWAGFTFGVGPDNYAFMPAPIYGGTAWAGFPNGIKQIAYTATFGGGWSATLALEDRKDWGYDLTYSDRVQTAANVVANVRLDQAWGFAVLHGLVGNNSIRSDYATFSSKAGSFSASTGAPQVTDTTFTAVSTNGATPVGTLLGFNSPYDAKVGQSTFSSWAIGATVSYKLPMIAAGDQIWITANYAHGAIGALLGGSGMSNISTAAQHRLLGGVIRVDNNLVATSATTVGSTNGWNLGAIYTHYWAAQWRSNFSAGYVEINPPTVTSGTQWGKGKLYDLTGSIIYSPVKDFDIGLELQYANLKNNIQNPTAAFVTAGSPGLSVNNISTKLRVGRAF